ncbi:MAG: DNA polymerase IV [Erysipelotrichaceae bacterium]|jgi:DNA polymerase-4
MKDKVIFHIDINHCYAQIEEMKQPHLRDVPMAVGGHEEKRHGIILAKNDLAKAAHVMTGESLREAKQKCPDLLIIPPSYDDYIYYTGLVKDIYRQYSDHVESFGLDEAWIDYTDSRKLYGEPVKTACLIQDRVEKEIGLTVSVGVSWNKAFAKLGSDMKKSRGMTVITRDNYQKLVWPLPAEDLLYVGPATIRRLHTRGIMTIGDLAQYPAGILHHDLGIAGDMIQLFARGEDPSPVAENGASAPIKSVGNSMTLVHDVKSFEEVKPVLWMLCEAVASRARDAGMEGSTVYVSLRSTDLAWAGRQMKLERATDVSEEIMAAVELLVHMMWHETVPLRAAGVSLGSLKEASSFRQLRLFEDAENCEAARRCDLAMDEIRRIYGFDSVKRLCTLNDEKLTDFNVKADHTVHPVGYFQGRKMG